MNTNALPMERQLVKGAADGSREAFDALVDRHYKGVYAHAYRILRNAEDAADATQVTFVKVHRSIREFDQERPFRPWLYRICGNLCIDISRGKHRSHDSLDKHAFRLESDCKPHESAQRSDLQSKIYRAILKLPERYRRIVVMRHYEQMDVEEIAHTLGAPEGTIKSWLFRARAILRSELEGVLESPKCEAAV